MNARLAASTALRPLLLPAGADTASTVASPTGFGEIPAAYRVVQWALPTPDQHISAYAHKKEHMSTDAPDADLSMRAESVGPDATGASHQEDTLVLSAHRGHHLGMLVKTAGLLAWRTQHPRSAHVIAYNAEENRPMLSINEAIGFAPISYEGAWKKELV